MVKIELEGKEYNLPENAEEMTLGVYEKIQTIAIKKADGEEYTYDDVVTIISMASNIDRQLILVSPVDFFNTIFEILKWVFDIDLSKFPLKKEVEIDGEKYTYNESANVTLKEWVDIDTVLKSFPDEDKLSGILSIRLRKQDEKYNPDLVVKRTNTFKQAKISEIFPIITFFLTSENLPSTLMQTYSQALELARMQQEINEDLIKNGVGSQQLSTWQKMMYYPLNQSYKRILTQFSLIYPTLLTNTMLTDKQNKNIKLDNNNQDKI